MSDNSKSKNIHYIDVYGKELIVSRAKNGNINFILCHDAIQEGNIRQEFQSIILTVSKESKRVYNLFKGLYEVSQTRTFISKNPIRDGRNFMFLQKINENYSMIVRHDLANELRNPFETKIEISGKYINDLYEENLETSQTLLKRLHH